jgi:chromosome segregation ATPase
MKFTAICALVAITATANRDVKAMLDKAIKSLDNTSDYLSNDVEPEVEYIETSKEDLKDAIKDVDWHNLKNW